MGIHPRPVLVERKRRNDLFKGIFWQIDTDTLITYKIHCDADGNPLNPDLPYNSRRGDSFTHKATWEEATKNQPREIRNKAWNHFPRGRVEIKASNATVYHNPTLTSPEFEEKIKNEFELTDEAQNIRFTPDHSRHYHVAE